MRKLSWIILASALVLFVALALPTAAPSANAQSGGGYDLTWNTLDGGGGTSTGGAYSLAGTIGQADAGVMSGGAYTLTGGFWVDFLGNRIMLPLIRR